MADSFILSQFLDVSCNSLQENHIEVINYLCFDLSSTFIIKNKLLYQGIKSIQNMMKFNFSIITQVAGQKQDTIVTHVIGWKYGFGQNQILSHLANTYTNWKSSHLCSTAHNGHKSLKYLISEYSALLNLDQPKILRQKNWC